MGYLSSVKCPFCGQTTLSYRSGKTVRMRNCSNRECGKKFFFYMKHYYIRLDDIQLLREEVKNKLIIALSRGT